MISTDIIIQRVSDISAITGNSFNEIDYVKNNYKWENIEYVSNTDTIKMFIENIDNILMYAVIGYCTHHEINLKVFD